MARTRAVFSTFIIFYALWAALQQQRNLSSAQKRRFQMRAAAHGDVDAVEWCGDVGDDLGHLKRLCASAARDGQLQVLD